MWRQADSRDYITPFSVFRPDDAPRDMELPAGLGQEFSGLFLPRARQPSKLLGASPPRLLVLSGRVVWIVPRRPETPVRLPLDSLETLECGRILLAGWIGLAWSGRELTLPYNRHSAATVERFLAALRNEWLPESSSFPPEPLRGYGPPPDLKFANAKSLETPANEEALLQFFQPPTTRTGRRFLLRRRTCRAGDLLLLTNRRLLWISDRYRTLHEPYGTVSRSAPLTVVERMLLREDAGIWLETVLASGRVWRIPLHTAGEDEADEFVRQAALALEEFRGCRAACRLGGES